MKNNKIIFLILLGLGISSDIFALSSKVRVILSTNNDPMYINFWPLTAKVWRDLIGVTPTLALIAPATVKIDESWGDVIRFDFIDGVPEGEQAKMIRNLLPAYFEEDICIISDIDMIPMNKEYFIKPLEHCEQDKVVVYRDKVYPLSWEQIPMCYVAAKGKIFKEIFGINTVDDISGILKDWWTNFNHGISTDEKCLYRGIVNWHKYSTHCINLDGRPTRRLDRLNWRYSEAVVRNGGYDDCHMLRPYNDHKKAVDRVIEIVLSGKK